MANFASAATQIAGNALVRTASAVAINQATSYISRAFDNRTFEGPRLDSFRLQTSRDGAPMPRIFGRVRLAGQVIWANHVRERTTETPVGGKGGGPTQRDFAYSISLAIGLCEGEIAGIERIWANGAPLETAGLDMRVYTGTEDQMPDPILAATEGEDAPAFRGTAYVVFEDFPLGAYGNRLPQFNFEVVRSGKRIGRLETQIQSVCLLPGSGEFAYATEIVEESPRPGQTRPVNMNNLSGQADIERALDQLQATLPNCRNVSIISSWFASSTDIADCEIRPGVERRVRNLRNGSWQVGRDTRNTAYLVSTDEEGRPNFGGTPSDESLIQAIRAIKARGLSVTLYPFMMVDAPGFPWRGRITGTASNVRRFFGDAMQSDYSIGAGEDHYRANDTGFRNYILSHANLARRAGGVDRFIIGSEMIGLTTIRDGQNNFPAVTELAELAEDVRTMLGPETGLTYAADWSEYFGYHPQDGSGDVFFHLDDLWSHPAIDAVGIDAYLPLSDWRDGAHVDGEAFNDIYDPHYLRGNVEGGEGYDWYYASQTDRDAQIRSPITNWIYRYKDLRNWWSNPHRNSINGITQAPTKWVPQSKPFWLTEIGCPAVDKGANQPNLFSDGKSVESNIPYYSTGSRDDLVQRRYLESLIGYWEQSEINPVSDRDGRSMIDLSAISVWAWDARPFPDFPARTDVWSDGPNWQRGHWISGRLGGVPLQDVITEICDDVGLDAIDLSGVNGLVSGFIIDRPMRAKDVLAPLIDSYDLVVREQAGQVSFAALSALPTTPISAQHLLAQDGAPIQFAVDDNMTSLRDARLTFIDATRDYEIATISARNALTETVRIAQMQAPILMDPAQAKAIVENRLARSEPSRRAARFSMAVQSAPTVGDLITLPETEELWQVVQIRSGLQADINCIALPEHFTSAIVSGGIPAALSTPQWVSEPVALAFDLPGTEGLQVGALQDPFRATELGFQSETVRLNTSVKMGALLTELLIRPATHWDRQSQIEIYMPEGAGFSVPEIDVLNGANRFAVETSLGWEIIAAANITLIGEQTFRLDTLLRGVNNSDDMMIEVIPAGARVFKLDDGLGTLRIDEDFIGDVLDISVSSAGRAGVAATHQYRAVHLRPLSVVHMKVKPVGEQTQLNWIPRNLDNSDKIDPDTQVQITWPGGELLVSGTQALLPIQSGSDTPVTLTPIDPIGGQGASKVIYI
jgi:hypothetical protein